MYSETYIKDNLVWEISLILRLQLGLFQHVHKDHIMKHITYVLEWLC